MPLALSDIVRILNFDGSVVEQTGLIDGLTGRIETVDLIKWGPIARYFATRPTIREIERTLAPERRNRITLLGSGDYHHLTASLLRQFDEPLSVVVFDTHPDWDRTSPWPCCGSWIGEALKLPNVRRVVMIGLGRCDLDGWRVNWGRVGDLYRRRVEFYPYDCESSRAFGRWHGELACAIARPSGLSTRLSWHRVVDTPWRRLLDGIIDSLPTPAVYVSIDKDALRRDAAITNWEEGGLELPQLLDALRWLAERRTIVGADITGEYSPVQIRPWLFRKLAEWERPRLPVPTATELERNAITNRALLDVIGVPTIQASVGRS